MTSDVEVQPALTLAASDPTKRRIAFAAGDYGRIGFASGLSGSDGNPIHIFSLEPLAAKVTTASTSLPAIGGGGNQWITVEGFDVDGGKDGIAFTRNGNDFDDPCGGITITANRVRGPVQDGIKVAGGSDVVVTYNDAIGGSDQAIDLDAVSRFLIGHNAAHCPAGERSIIVKMGCNDGTIIDNDCTGAIGCGDTSGAGFQFNPDCPDVEARDVIVSGNVITPKSQYQTCIDVVGANLCTIAADNVFTFILPRGSAADIAVYKSPAVTGIEPTHGDIFSSAITILHPTTHVTVQAGSSII